MGAPWLLGWALTLCVRKVVARGIHRATGRGREEEALLCPDLEGKQYCRVGGGLKRDGGRGQCEVASGPTQTRCLSIGVSYCNDRGKDITGQVLWGSGV